MRTNRVKELRKELRLSQEEFGRKLGVSRGVIVNVELNRAEIKPLFIEHLCLIFNVNKSWLFTGFGPMFNEDKKSLALEQFCAEYHLDEIDRQMIECYLQLDAVKRQGFKDYFTALFSALYPRDTEEENLADEPLIDQAAGQSDRLDQEIIAAKPAERPTAGSEKLAKQYSEEDDLILQACNEVADVYTR